MLLAAGTGKRLSPLTDGFHKCLTEVNEVPILKQQVTALEHLGFEELVVVVGYREDQIRDFLAGSLSHMKVSYVRNPHYRTTNNLYSLWLAREAIKRSFLLLECDLFFDADLLFDMLHPDRIAVATPRPWMQGTTVSLDDSQCVTAYHLGNDALRYPLAFKTVNIHSLSLPTWRHMIRCLDAYVSAGRLNDYYEAVFRDMVATGAFNPQAVSFDDGRWYEIDTQEDLSAAEMLFPNDAVPPGLAVSSRDPIGV